MLLNGWVLKCIEVRAPLQLGPGAPTVNATEHEAHHIRWKRSSALLSKHTELFHNPIPVELRPLNVTRVTSTTLSRHRKEPSLQCHFFLTIRIKVAPPLIVSHVSQSEPQSTEQRSLDRVLEACGRPPFHTPGSMEERSEFTSPAYVDIACSISSSAKSLRHSHTSVRLLH
ncbi:hypothetical protein OG21DRAFT_1130438 [Imleria badia]|nr:hypothetical protein OG21DRAFT_1130438 [Imleria badia]